LSWGDNPRDQIVESARTGPAPVRYLVSGPGTPEAGYVRQSCKVISDPKPRIFVEVPLGYIYFEMKGLDNLEGSYYGRPINPGYQASLFHTVIRMKRAN